MPATLPARPSAAEWGARPGSAKLPGIAIDVGSRIRDYEIVARLKGGGMATLFLARRSGAAGFSRHVAIKVVHPHLAEDPSFIRMFVDEALLSARIQHPNVVHVEELGEDKGTYFLVMEYVHGSALSTLLGTLARQDRRLSPELAVHIAMKVADGLDAAHELRDEQGNPLGVVHRDVSPQNVLLSATGHVKLIDFGIAKATGQGRRTETGSLKGKVRYMSPEQAFGQNIDRRTDVYALAIVLWEMLTMQRMFKANNDLALLDEVRNPHIVPPSAFSPELPPALDRVLLRALARDPAQRPATARDLRRELQDAYPAAAAVGEERLGEVVRAVLGEHIELRRMSLPDSVAGLSVRSLEQKSDIVRNEVLRTMTVSAPGARFALDHEVSEPRVPAAAGTGAAGSVPGQGGLGPTRMVVLGAGIVTLAAAAAAGVAIALSAPPPASAPTVTPLAPLAGSPGPVPPAVPTTPSVPSTPAITADDAGVAVTATAEEPPEAEPARVDRRPRDRDRARPSTSSTTMDEDGVRVIRAGGVTIYDDSY